MPNDRETAIRERGERTVKEGECANCGHTREDHSGLVCYGDYADYRCSCRTFEEADRG